MNRGVEPAVCVWLGVLAAALGWDLWLIRNGHRSLSTVAGESKLGRALVVYLACHLLVRSRSLHRLDPLSAIARRLSCDTMP